MTTETVPIFDNLDAALIAKVSDPRHLWYASVYCGERWGLAKTEAQFKQALTDSLCDRVERYTKDMLTDAIHKAWARAAQKTT